MDIEYSKQAVKAVKGLDRPVKQRIKEAIEKIPQGDIKPLKGSKDSFRLRVGDWRILFSYQGENTILIEKSRRAAEYIRGYKYVTYKKSIGRCY